MMEPNAVERVERWNLNADEIQELVKTGFMAEQFLDGKVGTGQNVEFHFDLGHMPAVMVTVTTLEKQYEERKQL